LKKETGSELNREKPTEDNGLEVPVPFFNGLLAGQVSPACFPASP